MDRDNVEAHFRLGNLLAKRGQLDAAIAHYQAALGLAAAAKSVGSAGNFRVKATLAAGCGQRGRAQQPWPAVVSPRRFAEAEANCRGPAPSPTTPTRISRWAWSSFRKIGGPKRWPSGGRAALAAPVAEHVESAGAALGDRRRCRDSQRPRGGRLGPAGRTTHAAARPANARHAAAAYAEAGRFAAAVQTAQEAVPPAAVGDAKITADLRRLKLYQAGSAFHQPPARRRPNSFCCGRTESNPVILTGTCAAWSAKNLAGICGRRDPSLRSG